MSTTNGDASTGYIPRREEAAIRDQVEKVRSDRTNRALLISGPGGTGKTVLVQEMARRAGAASGDIVWVPPIDVDDSEYWLLSNLETAVARAVDPAGEHFQPYFEYLARLSRYEQQRVSYETVLTQLGRINQTFTECYRTFLQATGRTVVITLDTIEAIRGMYLLLTLTQWMKRLPATLFILSGRPLSRREHQDPIREELSDPHFPLEFSEIDLSGFNDAEARLFLQRSELEDTLSSAEQDQLIALTEGQPLWLALAIEYLQVNDLPPEMTTQLDEQDRPQEQFRRRLVTLYRSTDFWPEAIKRLAVVRHSVNQDVWQRLMVEPGLPPDAADWDEAWTKLLQRPWVRPRANRRYVTLHDALAEELAQRLIPLHDQDQAWQRDLWRRAKDIYAELTADKDERLPAERRRLTAALGSLENADPRVVSEVAQLDAQKRELDQLQTAQLHYTILDNFGSGTEQFLRLYDQASNRRDPLFLELICHEVERFVPRSETSQPIEDVMGGVLRKFQRWLQDDAPERHIEIAVRLASFLIGNEQAGPALELLSNLPDESTVGPKLRYRLAIERGNACMRIPGHVDAAQDHFRVALVQAREFPEPDSVLGQAAAHKELGFYYRNLGRWPDADDAYQTARDVLSRVMGPGSPNTYREEMASILTNWAYLKALRGDYTEARNLVDSAIGIRRRIGQRHSVGVSLSVSGEVHRYDGKFRRAWKDYKEAETIFHEFKSWPWLGLLYQEMAICLYHSTREGLDFEEDQPALARALIRQSLDICRESAPRAYSSALNRAARIHALTDIDLGLKNLAEAIDEARKIGDGWFLSANLMEYLELSYRAWTDTERPEYREGIAARVPDVTDAITTYAFPDLSARWELLQGHLLVHDALASGQHHDLDEAVRRYSLGFRTLADTRVGSHGSAAIAREFVKFRKLFDSLPQMVQRSWYEQLLADWSSEEPKQLTSLLARLEELY
jgi:tetratricopeptide (TPR) repeat protein